MGLTVREDFTISNRQNDAVEINPSAMLVTKDHVFAGNSRPRTIPFRSPKAACDNFTDGLPSRGDRPWRKQGYTM